MSGEDLTGHKMDSLKNLKLKDVKEIYSDSSSCVKKVTSNYILLIHPIHLQDIRVAVKNELNSMIKCYIKGFGGILMGFESVKVVSPVGFLFHSNVFLHVNINADFYIFAPSIGTNLKAKVVKKSPNHVGCLVHGIFNASSSIPYSLPRDQWTGSKVNEGDTLEMKVTELNFNTFVPYVRGDILADSISKASSEFNSSILFNEEDSGISSIDNSFGEDDLKKRKKKKTANNLVPETNQDDLPIRSPSNIKKEKKKKNTNVLVPETNQDDLPIRLPSNIKKEKKKKNANVLVPEMNQDDLPIRSPSNIKKEKCEKEVVINIKKEKKKICQEVETDDHTQSFSLEAENKTKKKKEKLEYNTVVLPVNPAKIKKEKVDEITSFKKEKKSKEKTDFEMSLLKSTSQKRKRNDSEDEFATPSQKKKRKQMQFCFE